MPIKIIKRVAIIAAVFAVIISILLIANYIQTKSIDPLNSKAITQLMSQLRENPNDNALKEQIRALDLLARKAYFTYQWQVRTGSILLFIFVLVFLLAVKYISSLESQHPDLSEDSEPEDTWENRLLSRRTIIFSGLGLFLLAFVLGMLTEHEMNRFGPDRAKGAAAGDVEFPTDQEIRKHWPGFRGHLGNAVSYHTGVPTQWDGKSNKNIAWKTPVPLPGFNSPILWGDRVFLSGADKKNQQVYCIDAVSGSMLWQADVKNVPGSPANPPKTTDDTGYAASTMTTDGKRVFVIFATGDTACFDFQGKPIWMKNLGVPGNHYGHASSLLTYHGLLLVQYDQKSGGRLLAMKADTGIVIYDKPRDVEISWASPILAQTGEQTQLILNATPYVIGYDPLTGRELWRLNCMSGEVAPSPAYADGIVYVVNDNATLTAIRLGDKPAVAWEYEDDLADVPSPLAGKEFLFMASSYGSVACFNAKTGKKYWLHDFDRGFYSSPVLVEDNVYLMDMNGNMHIFKAAKQFELIATNPLGEKSVTTPAFSNQRIYIRGEKHLFRVGSEKKQ
jgi:outer membrane protein assembly factor BamB